MTVIQTQLDIPVDIYSRLLSNELVRHGGVVRDQAGRLVTLLDDAPIDKAQQAAAASIATLQRNPKYVLIGVGVVAIAATAGAVAYLVTRGPKAAQPELPTSVENFSASLSVYLEAARHRTLDAEIIDRLIADIDAVKAEADSGTIVVAFLPEQWETLVELVAGHTSALAEANQFDVSNLPDLATAQGATITDLRPYLEVQREIFSQEPS